MRHADHDRRWRDIALRHARAARFIRAAFGLACLTTLVFVALAIVVDAHRTAFVSLTVVALLAVGATGLALRGARDFRKEFGERFPR